MFCTLLKKTVRVQGFCLNTYTTVWNPTKTRGARLHLLCSAIAADKNKTLVSSKKGWIKGILTLGFISKVVIQISQCYCNVVHCTIVQNVQNRTPKWTLWDTTDDRNWDRRDISNTDWLPSSVQVREQPRESKTRDSEAISKTIKLDSMVDSVKGSTSIGLSL